METDKNNNVETMEVDEKLLSAAEEAQAQKEKNETFLEYCKRKHINKKAPKSRNAYNQSVTSADKILCENNRIKECMQKKRAFFEQKCETNEITKIAKLSTSQRVLKKARRKNADAKAEKRENETEKEKEERLQRDAESKQIKRESETVEEKQQRLNDDKNEKAIKRTINRIEKQEKLKNERAERLKNAKTKSSFTPQKAANYKGVKPFRLGKRDVICNGCGAKHYRAEKRQKDGTFTNCCQQGKVKMQVGVFDYPQLFKDLMTKKHENREYATTRIIWINQQVAYFIC
uniref:Uncharacterized protein n=1 Tax=Panagrolaimus sp. PS1159 TaxID=55785 RepID=A0AC35EUB1_9BILA